MEINKFISKYEIVSKIGKGVFGIIYKIRDKENGNILAVKRVVVNKDYPNREIDNMKIVNHNNVIKLIDFILIINNEYYKFLELFSNNKILYNEEKELYDSTNKNNDFGLYITELYDYSLSQFILTNIFKENKDFFVMFIIKEVAKGLKYFKEIHFLHRDLKPDNIFIKLNDNLLECEIVIGDLGSGKFIDINDKETGIAYICSRPYRAPELLLGLKKYDYTIDTWSLGCLLYYIITNKHLFNGESGKFVLREITNLIGPPKKSDIQGMGDKRNIQIKFDYEIISLEQRLSDKQLNKDILEILKGLLKWNPKERLDINEILKK